MRCKWLICLDFSPPKYRTDEKVHSQAVNSLAGRSMPTPVTARKRRVPGTSLAKLIALQTSRRFTNTTTEYHACSPLGCMRIQLRPSPLTGSPPMTPLMRLIYPCPQRLCALFEGLNQTAALAWRAQEATILVANTCLTPAHSIHAPTPRPFR